jgi:hypothetical protein
VDFAQNPLILRTPRPGRQPFDSNQAISTILFEKELTRFQSRYPQFAVRSVRRIAFFAYPLSGGFEHPSLMPTWLVASMLNLEQKLEGLGWLFAFRMFVVLERQL